MSKNQFIRLKNVKVHNLKSVNLEIQPGQLTVFTGVSGSGKSSLAFDTIYVEGQRRYIESLSTHARRQLGDLSKPNAESISGLSPPIAIEQKTTSQNPRSTVGTLTGIYDFFRVLYAKLAIAHCPISGEPVSALSDDEIAQKMKHLPEGKKILILAPILKGKKSSLKDELAELLRKGFMRVRIDGKIYDLSETIEISENVAHDLDVVVDRTKTSKKEFSRLVEAALQALAIGNGVMSVYNVDDESETLFSKHAFSAKSNQSYPPLKSEDFSFNHPTGMCDLCQGLGRSLEFDLTKIIDEDKSISEDCCKIAGSYSTVRWGNIYRNIAELYNFDVDKPWKKLSERAKKQFLYGNKKRWTRMHFVHPETGKSWYDYVKWRGVVGEAKRRLTEAKSDFYKKSMEKLMVQSLCSMCEGSRLKSYPSVATFHGKTIYDLTHTPIGELTTFFSQLILSQREQLIGEDLLQEIILRLKFLNQVGLHYLTLDRSSPSLSGGEAQRVRLAYHLGSGLVGTTYILDEPSIGLHPRDNEKLIKTLLSLRDRGNTVLVVEHDEETILSADVVIDVGPKAGFLGGEILFQGPPEKLKDCKESLTSNYLFGRASIEGPKTKRKPSKRSLQIKGASHNNLKNLSIHIPLECFIAVTGVSGSGKSSLILETLYPYLANKLHRAEHPVGKHEAIEGLEHIDKVIAIDQTPIGRTPRSNPATYIKLFDDIRDLFCNLKESKLYGYKPGRFSFNVLEGSCQHCRGMGYLKVDMDFMEDVWTLCNLCHGKRFDSATLSIKFKGKSIYDVLEMTIEEALLFFEAIPNISKKLEVLYQVGLGYISLGQSSTTLSGGEAQRIKLAKELVRPSTGRTIYILDEPTTGLHFDDIDKLLKILQRLVDQKNTVIVIEHNMDLVKTADHIIDLGPEGGSQGGYINFEGTPETLKKKSLPTGVALKKTIEGSWDIASSKQIAAANEIPPIEVFGARQNYLKSVNATLPHGKITVCTGPSGSGKSSFAFDTIYAEGQRRYVETLSSYARQFVKQMPKAKLDSISGLCPSIAIEQKHHAGNPRSTIGTMTEIYDYLRVLYARLGKAFCPETKEPIKTISKEFVVQKLIQDHKQKKLVVLAHLSTAGIDFESLKEKYRRHGFLRIRLNGKYHELDETIDFDPKVKNELFLVIDRLMIKESSEKRLHEAIDTASKVKEGLFTACIDDKDYLFNLRFAVESTGKSYPPLTPQTFSFNSDHGMCRQCFGIGMQFGANLASDEKVLDCTTSELLLDILKENVSKKTYKLILAFCEALNIDPDKPISELSSESQNTLFYGSKTSFTYNEATLTFYGIHRILEMASDFGKPYFKKPLSPLLEQSVCKSCQGSRLNPLALLVELQGKTLPALCQMPLDEACEFIQSIQLDKEQAKVLDEPISQISSRLKFLCQIGLEYLSLERNAPSLSGGETQRIYLARQLGSGLTGTLYVLDEPTIGLHPHNNHLLNESLKHLKELGNTLVIVEHDPMTVKIADHIIDFGPEAGRFGGEIVAEGNYQQLLSNPKSLTGQYLSGKKVLTKRQKPREATEFFKIEKATTNNLKTLSLQIGIGQLTCVTGLSGSGKSSLVMGTIAPLMKEAFAKRVIQDRVEKSFGKIKGARHFDKLLVMTQNPIGQTSRSDISTYVELFSILRTFFSELPLAKAKGLKPRHFSFNHKSGMCKACYGMGYKSIDLQFLPAVKITCEQCHGLKLNPVSLQIEYKEKNLGQILQMTLEEATGFLPEIPKIQKILAVLEEVGLSYLKLGQDVQTLSGGEAQRLRLAKELAKRSRKKTLFLFDEPTIGLHFVDIEKLIQIFHKLVNTGHTIIVIEHNLDIIANSDMVIDMGPGGGTSGGSIIFHNTPESLIKEKNSLTGKYLKDHLS